MENNIGHVRDSKKSDGIKWLSKDWTFQIQIQMSEDWNISSFFIGYISTNLALDHWVIYTKALGKIRKQLWVWENKLVKALRDGNKNRNNKKKDEDEDECTWNNQPKKCVKAIAWVVDFSKYVTGTDLTDVKKYSKLDYNAIVKWSISVKYPGKTKVNAKEIFNRVDTKYTHVTKDMAECRVRNLEPIELERALKDITEYVNNFWDYGCVKVDNPRQKVEEKISHIMKPNFTWIGENKKYQWLHSVDELDEDSYVVEYLTEWNYDHKPYEAIIYVAENINEWNSYWEAIIKRSPGTMSSMFPDSWTRQKIMYEVTHAVKYNRWRKFPNATNSNKNIYSWYISDNITEISFVVVNWKILTYYPFID